MINLNLYKYFQYKFQDTKFSKYNYYLFYLYFLLGTEYN